MTQSVLKLPIENFDTVEKVANTKHSKLLPNYVRAIFCGPSGCGKTNSLLALLFNENGLRFENIYVYSKSLYQPKYTLLEDVLRAVNGVGYFPYSDNDMIMDPELARKNSIFVFDDVACEKQDKIRAYFSMGRHRDIDAAYLCQTYSKIPKQLIRDNCNVIVLFKQDDMNLRHVFDEHVSPDMSYDVFKLLCSQCWNGSQQYGALVIVKDFELNDGRYRRGFDEYITVS
jgi:hypothetical protein